MAWEVERAEAVGRDLDAIFDFLLSVALDLGEDLPGAFDRASARILAIEDAMEALGQAPHQGTLRPDLGPGVRHVTKGRAALYFDLDEARRAVRILAAFFGGQDHQKAMLLRALKR